MKRPLFLALLTLLLLGTIAETAYRADRDAGRQKRIDVVRVAPKPAATPVPTPSPYFQLVAVGSVMELPEMIRSAEKPSEARVVVVPWGSRYHHPVCSFGNGGTMIWISEARKKGYKPCKECSGW